MYRITCVLIALACGENPITVTAATLFESGVLGPTDISRSEIAGGSNVSSAVFVGVRFHLDQPVITSQIGGHFVRNAGTNESFFGGIVALADENGFPDSGDLSTPDVVGTTLLAFPERSNEVFGAIAKPLSPGWYALVFGSGLFGASGSGVALANGADIGDPTYIGWQLGAVNGWGNLINPIFRNFRFVIQGHVVPEPASAGIAMIAILLVAAWTAFWRRLITSNLGSWLAIVVATVPGYCRADTIFESGTLGPTGLPQGSVSATNITFSVFTGVRFELTQPVLTAQVGGHFVSTTNGTFFGAIVALDDENDFPDSGDLSTPDVLGAATLTFPVPSAEVFGDLEVSLDPGWYALVFGSGLFGTGSDGAAPRNGMDIDDPMYVGWQPGAGFGWGNLNNPIFRDHRFVIRGSIVPEPASACIAIAATCLVANFGLGRISARRRTCMETPIE